MGLPHSSLAQLAAVFLAGSLLSGCGSDAPKFAVADSDLKAEEDVQSTLALDTTLDEHARLLDVAFPLSAAAADLCGKDVTEGFGLNIATLSGLREELRDAAAKKLSLDDSPQILHVVPQSPADKAGLKTGDKIVALDHMRIEPGDKSADKVMERLHRAKSDPVIFEISRKNETSREITVAPVPICKVEFFIGKSDAVNAFSDGDSVIIMAGMMRFAATKQELALVLSHEMAHAMMRDEQVMPAAAIPGAIADFVVSDLFGINTQRVFTRGGGRSYTQDFEAEADTVGLYVMARAGFDIDGAPEFWRRIAANYPESIKDSLAAAHPATPYRFVLLKQTIAEIKDKQAKNEPLVPELLSEKVKPASGPADQSAAAPGKPE